ncbi:MAG TPA: aryl-sulfate sulfotransferase [Polyangiaceae bacterium]
MTYAFSRARGRLRFTTALPGALAAAVVVAACGSESNDATPGAGNSGTSPSAGISGAASGSPGAGGAGSGSVAGSSGSGGGSGTSPGSGGSAAGAAGATSGGAAGTVASGGAGSGGSGGSGGLAGGTAGTAGMAGAGGAVVVGSISDLTIEANPRSVLSAYVKWTTAEPASSVVQFGEGALTWEIEGESGVTEHEVLVIGMHAESDYQIRALSTGASGTLEGTGTFTTGVLPAQIPLGTISVYDAAKAQPGWTLMNVQKGDGTNRAYSGAPPAAVIYDEAGKPVWYFIHGTNNERGGAISVDRTDVGVVMGASLTTGAGSPSIGPVEVDWGGNTVWTCDDPLCGVPDQLSHHTGKLSNGNHITMRDASTGGRTDQVFIELSTQNQMVHSIGVSDVMTPPSGATGDWAHGNSITVDLENDVAYLSFRWLGVAKLTYSTKALQWHLPAKYGQTSLNSNFGDMTFVPPSSQFSDIHDPEIHDDGTILFFDNGGFSGVIEDGNPGNRHTRAVEYAIDETAKTATLVWEWPGTFQTDAWYKEQLYVPFWGDADRLANGNVLIAAGRRGTASITPESRVIEVTRDTGAVAWELKLPKDYGVYRAERLDPLPLVKKIAP